MPHLSRVFSALLGMALLAGSIAGSSSVPAQAADAPQKTAVPVAASPARATLCKQVGKDVGLLYLPVYSSIRYLDDQKSLLAISIAIRNISPDRAITVVSADFYDADGNKVSTMLPAPRELAPLATEELYLRNIDFPNHTAASVIIGWKGTEEGSTPPAAESVMVASKGNQTLSFTRGAIEMPDCQDN